MPNVILPAGVCSGSDDAAEPRLTEPRSAGPWVELSGMQESHILHGFARANCLIVIPEECRDLSAASWVDVIPLES